MTDRDYGDVEHGDCPYSWLNEWLCEYVDGTMDPSLRAVFDEYLTANPELAEHVERLCRTRSLLCQCKGHKAASDVSELRARLSEATERELLQVSLPFLSEGGQLRMTMAAGSAMLVMLTVGVVLGATFFAADPLPMTRRTGDRPAEPPPQVEASTQTPFRAPVALPARSFSTPGGSFFSPFVDEPTLQTVGQGTGGATPSLLFSPSPIDTSGDSGFQLVMRNEY